jgi:hypothetical protein
MSSFCNRWRVAAVHGGKDGRAAWRANGDCLRPICSCRHALGRAESVVMMGTAWHQHRPRARLTHHSRSAARSQSWVGWTRWPPTTTGTPRAALAPSSPRASAPRARTYSTCSSLNPLRVLSLRKTRAVQPLDQPRGTRISRQVAGWISRRWSARQRPCRRSLVLARTCLSSPPA